MPTLNLELGLRRQGYLLVAGVDEAGRGPLAGPLVAAAVILPWGQSAHHWLGLVDDSKVLSPRQRDRALEKIEAHARAIGVGVATAEEIDAVGIAPATKWAMGRAVDNLPVKPSYLLVDFVKLPECGVPHRGIVHGDSLCYSIAAASIVAKVTRDRLMEEADVHYPGYGFSRHKGYPTQQHLSQLALRGPCPIHRISFAPVRAVMGITNGQAPEAARITSVASPASEGAG